MQKVLGDKAMTAADNKAKGLHVKLHRKRIKCFENVNNYISHWIAPTALRPLAVWLVQNLYGDLSSKPDNYSSLSKGGNITVKTLILQSEHFTILGDFGGARSAVRIAK